MPFPISSGFFDTLPFPIIEIVRKGNYTYNVTSKSEFLREYVNTKNLQTFMGFLWDLTCLFNLYLYYFSLGIALFVTRCIKLLRKGDTSKFLLYQVSMLYHYM